VHLASHPDSARWAQVMDECLAPLQNYPTSQSLYEVGWRTVICNYEHLPFSCYLADPSLEVSYSAFSAAEGFLPGLEAPPEANDPAEFAAFLQVGNGFRKVLESIKVGHRICRTPKGYVGLASERSEVRDLIYIIHDLQVPFVIRPDSTNKSRSRLVGGCYIHGIIDGEAMQGDIEDEVFVIG
jgi:hypothetical protein